MTTVPSGKVALVGSEVASVQPPAVAGAPPAATESVWPTEPVIWRASVSPACVRNAGRAGVGHADVAPTVAGNGAQGPTLRISGKGVVGLLIPPLALDVTLTMGVPPAGGLVLTVVSVGAAALVLAVDSFGVLPRVAVVLVTVIATGVAGAD
jgi:hypothetical protein